MRPLEPSIQDRRGRLVRSVGMAQTFLSPAQVDDLVAAYKDGVSVTELGKRFGICTRTAVAHLVRRSVPRRRRGMAEEDVPKAARLYESGLSLMEVGRRFGVSQATVRRAIAEQGLVIRSRGIPGR